MHSDPIPAGSAVAPPAPLAGLSLGITGHRGSNTMFAANWGRIEGVLAGIFDTIDAAIAAGLADHGKPAPTRLHCLLADGVDLMANAAARTRGWEIVSPLPFGLDLNIAINALPDSAADARALLAGGEAADADVQTRAAAIRRAAADAHLFELAERDDLIAGLYLDMLEQPSDIAQAQAFAAHTAERVALAGQVMIEQSDIIIGVWDGVTRAFVGGTGHTIAAALEAGAPVVWIDAGNPETWRILHAPEALSAPMLVSDTDREAALAQLVAAALWADPEEGASKPAVHQGVDALASDAWHAHSSPWWTVYRRLEALFGGDGAPFRSLRQTYERPDRIAVGSGAAVIAVARTLPGIDADFIGRIDTDVLRRFAWSDGISAQLSDGYRGGMTLNFILSATAITCGIAYQPLASSDQKWFFAVAEFTLLAAILVITWLGRKRRLHGRWFETRRVAEYFRHAPSLLLMGVARPPGRWPKASETAWPEYYARHGLRRLGLPHVALSAAYLRRALTDLLDDHVVQQRDYHRAKVQRLTNVHHRLDRISEASFKLAVVSVTTYLLLVASTSAGLMSAELLHKASKSFTFFGVFFPTLGAALAGIRYFGDFERFAAISKVTAEKLDAVHTRIELLLRAPDSGIDYARAAELAHAADDIVFAEIENWQAVFGGKHITVPA